MLCSVMISGIASEGLQDLVFQYLKLKLAFTVKDLASTAMDPCPAMPCPAMPCYALPCPSPPPSAPPRPAPPLLLGQ